MRLELAKILWYVLNVMLLVLLTGSIIYTTVHDEFLSRYTNFVLLGSALLLITGCLINLSAATSFQIKETSLLIPAELLSDSDIEYDEDMKKIQACQSQLFNRFPMQLCNFVSFGIFHVTYGMITIAGFICLIASISTAIFAIADIGHQEDLQSGDHLQSENDLLYSAVCLAIPGIVIIVTVFILANTEEAYEVDKRKLDYTVFDEFIHVPTKVIAGKAFAAFLTGGTWVILQFFLGLTFFVYGVYAVFSISYWTTEDVQRWQQVFQMNSIYWILLTIMIFAVLVGIGLMGWVAMILCHRAKKSLMITMEENWQRNIKACEILLPNRTFNSLGSLRNRLRDRARGQWTAEERIAFDYISLPLWKSKRAFIEKSK